ncbi:MAG TPA: tRNA (N6-isopentenyl adenosine(37)-C2)-methylthiotransferase MiaB [Desulfitobacteriaceae bacterium]|nr:tRNA (N6-isopentenyl adenosine(37)-C2)-methylthiotransferase MiaB [Desulfitobacteriaceae bacterium]
MSGKVKKVVTLTFGCQMSERDAETLTEISAQQGYCRCTNLQEADLVIVNTCCVRESAENKILGKIGELKRLKDKKPGLIIAVAGCMVQQPQVLERLQKRAPHVDIWTGTFNLHNFSTFLKQAAKSEKTAVVYDLPDESLEAAPQSEKGKLQANVNIMYGCNNFCSYCIVPYVRGRERSRRPEDIIQEIRNLAASGCREVSLLGQNVNSYGLEFSPAYDFADLLKEVDQIPGLWRVRFITSHPKDLSDKLIAAIAAGTHLCEHIHLPVQAGSNAVLQRMNRKYTREYYLSRLAKIRELIPEVSITTDIIVGFPGETASDFLQTLELVEQGNFSQAFTFMYSKRSGTAAASMPEQIPLDVKKARLQELMLLQKDKSLAWRQKMLGKNYEILVEGPSKTNPDRLSGRTRSNELVVFPGNNSMIGTLVNVKIIEAGPWTMLGEISQR